jgi:plastocyanin
VDNHFHDVHVDDDITIAFGQGFIVKNGGSNLHNVTIPEIDFSEDIRPGEQVDFLGDTLAAGTYNIVCKYHSPEGMFGKITVSN